MELSEGEGDRLVVVPADAVALPMLYGYHRDARGWASLPEVRLQGRDLAQFTDAGDSERRPLTFDMSMDIL